MIKFLPFDFLGVSHKIPCKNKNAVYHLQISTLVKNIINKIEAIITVAIPFVAYSFNIIHLTLRDIENVDRN